LSPSESSIVGVCLDDTLIYYLLSFNVTDFLPLGGVGGVVTKIKYLNESTISIILDGQIIVRDILLGSPGQPVTK
jgi:hypothetical protein